MTSSSYINDELFAAGPPMRLQRSLGLVKPGELRVLRRATLVVLVGWVPLAVLAAVQRIAMPGQTGSFYSDFAVHARYLIATPALILAEVDCVPRLGKIVHHFLDSGLVTGADTARYKAAVLSTRQLLDSKAGDVIVLVLAYLVITALILYVSPTIMPEWHRIASPSERLSPAGYWHMLVSLPILLILSFGWLWRLIIWARFLLLMALLDLRLIPGHPDRAGGLKFVSSSLRGFRLIAFAMGTVVAGTIANFRIHYGAPPLGYKNHVGALLVSILILFSAPLTVFMKKLRQTKRRGTFEYGALAGNVGMQFDAKWLKRGVADDREVLEVPDFSATTDLYSVTANVYEMRDVPFGMKDLIGIAAAGIVPFIPLALLAIPFQVLLDSLVKMLL